MTTKTEKWPNEGLTPGDDDKVVQQTHLMVPRDMHLFRKEGFR